MSPSPFETYRELLTGASNSTACRLQEFVMSLYNDSRFLFRAASIRGFDERHIEIFLELAQWFNENGLNDPEFVRVSQDIIYKYEAQAEKNFAELLELKSLDPADYPYAPGENVESYFVALKNCEAEHLENQAKGYIR